MKLGEFRLERQISQLRKTEFSTSDQTWKGCIFTYFKQKTKQNGSLWVLRKRSLTFRVGPGSEDNQKNVDEGKTVREAEKGILGRRRHPFL